MTGFRHFIIKTAEVMMVVIVIFMTLGFAISGAGSAAMADVSWIVGAIIGAVIGFISASVIAAYFFLLAEIAQNTRRTA